MADSKEAPLNGYTKLMVGAVVSIICTLLVAVIIGLFSMSRQVALQEERHLTMQRVDVSQTELISILSRQVNDLIANASLIRDRQENTRGALEDHGKRLTQMERAISEHQLTQASELSLIRERIRVLERLTRQPDQP